MICPSSPLDDEALGRATAWVRHLGLEPEPLPSTRARGPHPYLAGTDAARAADFTTAWCDDRYAAVWAARGGYGATRMLDLVDWRACARAGPKVLLGYSDVTCLHEAVAARLGVASLHAPMVGSDRAAADELGTAHLLATLFEPDSETARDLVGGADTTARRPGRARGWLTGGNLSLLAATIGTPSALGSHVGAIAVFEDVGEEPYRIDGYLTSMLRAGWFDGVVGVVLGDFTRCGPRHPVDAREDPSAALDVCTERLAQLDVPLLSGLHIGHGPVNRTLALGVAAALDADAGSLVLTESALI